MRRIFLTLCVLVALTFLADLGSAFAQRRGMRSPGEIRRQEDAIAKDDFRHNREDAAEILTLARDLMMDLNRDGVFVVDVKTIKAAERIEKLAKDVKGRLKRY